MSPAPPQSGTCWGQRMLLCSLFHNFDTGKRKFWQLRLFTGDVAQLSRKLRMIINGHCLTSQRLLWLCDGNGGRRHCQHVGLLRSHCKTAAEVWALIPKKYISCCCCTSSRLVRVSPSNWFRAKGSRSSHAMLSAGISGR